MSADRLDYIVAPGGGVGGSIKVPGDKSISHRAVMLGSIADGVTRISGLLEGTDVLATIQAFVELGVDVSRPRAGEVIVRGAGLRGLSEAAGPIETKSRWRPLRSTKAPRNGLKKDGIWVRTGRVLA